jgi:hypothetical protein
MSGCFVRAQKGAGPEGCTRGALGPVDESFPAQSGPELVWVLAIRVGVRSRQIDRGLGAHLAVRPTCGHFGADTEPQCIALSAETRRS